MPASTATPRNTTQSASVLSLFILGLLSAMIETPVFGYMAVHSRDGFPDGGLHGSLCARPGNILHCQLRLLTDVRLAILGTAY